MDIDFSLGNDQDSKLATGNFFIYLLRDNPSKSTAEFARGMNYLFDGLAIEIKENSAY